MTKKHKEKVFLFTSNDKNNSEGISISATSLGKAWKKLRRMRPHAKKKEFTVSE